MESVLQRVMQNLCEARRSVGYYGTAPARQTPMAEIRIGISGWTYAPWRGVFYPKELRKNRELEFASRRLNTIEINGSFYSLQRPTSYEKWYSMSPPDFKFAVKAG